MGPVTKNEQDPFWDNFTKKDKPKKSGQDAFKERYAKFSDIISEDDFKIYSQLFDWENQEINMNTGQPLADILKQLGGDEELVKSRAKLEYYSRLAGARRDIGKTVNWGALI